ncbi:MAG: chemotaxis protein CheW [Pseudomonadota bacterium]
MTLPSRNVANGAAATTEETLTLLVFRLAAQAFAVPVLQVSEILDPILRTPVPNAPPEIPALVNVRGTVVPLLDFRARIGLAPTSVSSGDAPLGSEPSFGDDHGIPATAPGHDKTLADVHTETPSETTAGTDTRFIVVDIAFENERQRLAVEVDAVETVIDVPASSVLAIPVLGAPWPRDMIRGAVRSEGGLIVVIEPGALCDTARMTDTPAQGESC